MTKTKDDKGKKTNNEIFEGSESFCVEIFKKQSLKVVHVQLYMYDFSYTN